MRALIPYALGLLTFLAAMKILVVWGERYMAFIPFAGVQQTPATLGLPYREEHVDTADGETITVWTLQHPDPRAQILFFHGNGGNLSIWLDVLAGTYVQGFTISALDYRGYGSSTGSPTEAGVYRDADAFVRHFYSTHLARNVPVVYWGRSLGCAVASYATRVRGPDAIILESPFADVRTLFRNMPIMWFGTLFASYRFATVDWLRTFKGPVLVLHGDRDSVIPFEQGEYVYHQLVQPKRFVRLPGVDHNDLADKDDQRYWRPIHDFVRELTQ